MTQGKFYIGLGAQVLKGSEAGAEGPMPRAAWHSHLRGRLKASSQGSFTFVLAPELPKGATADQRQEANK